MQVSHGHVAQFYWSLGIANLDEDSVRSTLGAVLKYREDQERVETNGMTDLIKAAVQRALGT